MQTRKEQFEQFHFQNPDVYEEIVRRARQVKAVGFKHFGIRRIYEGLRWHYALKNGPTTAEFKLNDHNLPHYSRLVMEQEPDLAGLFELRKLHDEVSQ